MTLRLPLSGNKHATIVSAYAPTMTNPDEVKDKFYNDLDDIISATPRTDKLILLGDFNARVGTDHQTWEGVIGPNIKTGLMRMMTKFRSFLKKSTDCTRHIKMILAQYPRKQPTATFVRQSRPSLGTCKIPG